MTSLDRQLARDGFIHIPAALSATEVHSLREHLHARFREVDAAAKSDRRRMLLPADILNDEAIWKWALAPKVVSSLKAALGERFVMLADLQVQRNLFGGWHTDSDTEAGAKYLFDSEYRFVKCGIYLQDNTEQWAGGIQLLKGGHRFPLRTPSISINYFLRSKRNRVIAKSNTMTVPLKAGDFLAFDSRIPHSATHPSKDFKDYFFNGGATGTSIANFPADKTKYVLYWDATSKQNYSDLYLQNRKARAQAEELARPGKSNEAFLSDFLRHSFPHSAPAFHAAAERAGVVLGQLPKDQAEAVDAQYRTWLSATQNRAA
jgi:hypothetical protein